MKKKDEIELHKQIRSQFQFDKMQMYMCKDYVAKNGIVVREPKMGEIIDIGEEGFYRNLNVWVTNTTSYRRNLWHMGIDWCKITDFELFCSLYKALDSEFTRLVFPNTDFSNFEQKYKVNKVEDKEEYEIVLYSETDDMVIDYLSYLEISQYLRVLCSIFPKDEFAKGKATKEAIIFEEDEKALKTGEDGFTSSLYPLVSTCINHPGFKYNLEQLKDIGIFAFMDAVARIQVYENTRALLSGSMSGFVDTKGIPKENFDFMRDPFKQSSRNTKSDSGLFNRVIGDYDKTKM